VHFAAARWVIGADRQERDLDLEAFSDLREAVEVGAVATMENRASLRLDHKPAEAAMRIMQHSRTPMMAGRQ
jgi:hypothetical protein